MVFRPAVSVITKWLIILLLLLAIFLPAYGPVMVYVEGNLFPVTSRVEIIRSEPVEGGREIQFKYEKYRACELIGVSWVRGNATVPFFLVSGQAPPTTRIPGFQVSKMWFLGADTTVDGTLWFLHRCHPFWITATKVYGH